MGRLASSSSRSGGDAVAAHGIGLILKPGSSRKDRHSKVLTSKGPRDRRVRLAAHTAIQFYDVQDRLGYDRPSKAVDWLINKARNSIDALAKLPPPPYNNPHQEIHSSRKPRSSDEDGTTFLPQFQIYPHPDLLSRSTQTQDLRLSLQSLVPEPNQEPFLGFDWNESRGMVDWNAFSGTGTEYLLSSQREPLQSSNNNTSSSIRAFLDPSSIFASPMAENHQLLNNNNNINNPSWVSDFGFPSSEYPGYQIPARIQNDDDDDSIPFKPSSDSCH